MPVYSKTGKKWSHDYEFSKTLKLDNVDLTADNIIYYHHPYDSLMEQVPLYDAIDSKNWNHINTNHSTILLHDNDSETFDISFVNDIVKTFNIHNINPAQLCIIVMDKNHKDFLERMLATYNITGVDIRIKNYLLSEIKIPKEELIPTKKFSMLSRNYRDWRLRLYVELLQRGILEKDFIYSFFNIWPYNDPPKVYNSAVMIEDLNKLNFTDITEETKIWLNSCPHELNSKNNVLNKWSNVTYDAIQSSSIHVIIETHYDQKGYCQEKEYDRNFAPSSITEKSYKSIACNRPFIVYATPYWLEDLRNLGFKTFSPYINEDYDRITDSLVRLNMIVNEIERISKLSNDEFKKLTIACQKIAEFNYNKLIEIQNIDRKPKCMINFIRSLIN